jgi:hypothetical protein
MPAPKQPSDADAAMADLSTVLYVHCHPKRMTKEYTKLMNIMMVRPETVCTKIYKPMMAIKTI